MIGKSNGPWDVETKGHFETPMIFLGILMCLPLMFTTSFYRYYGLCAVNFFVSLFFFSGLLLFFSKKNYFRIVIVSFLMMMGLLLISFQRCWRSICSLSKSMSEIYFYLGFLL